MGYSRVKQSHTIVYIFTILTYPGPYRPIVFIHWYLHKKSSSKIYVSFHVVVLFRVKYEVKSTCRSTGSSVQRVGLVTVKDITHSIPSENLQSYIIQSYKMLDTNKFWDHSNSVLCRSSSKNSLVLFFSYYILLFFSYGHDIHSNFNYWTIPPK